jgi:hypothetical protein
MTKLGLTRNDDHTQVMTKLLAQRPAVQNPER